ELGRGTGRQDRLDQRPAGAAAMVRGQQVEREQLALAHRVVLADPTRGPGHGKADDLAARLGDRHVGTAGEGSPPALLAPREGVRLPVRGREQTGVRLDPGGVVHPRAAVRVARRGGAEAEGVLVFDTHASLQSITAAEASATGPRVSTCGTPL